MKLNDPYKIVIKPIITEKASDMRARDNVYMFYVHPDATKQSIRRSIEKLFSVDVVSVRVINTAPKPRQRGQYSGKTASRKKAIVKLKKDQTIPVFEGLV